MTDYEEDEERTKEPDTKLCTKCRLPMYRCICSRCPQCNSTDYVNAPLAESCNSCGHSVYYG